MLGMDHAKREIKLIKSTTKVNLARAKMGLPVPVTSRHTLLFGPPGYRKDVGGTRVHQTAVRVDRAAQADGGGDQPHQAAWAAIWPTRRRTPRRCSKGHWAGRSSSTRCTPCTRRVTHQGDPYGNAIINTLLLYMENHRDELVVFGAGYAKAMEKMLEVNQGLRRRFSTVIEFYSYTPDELIALTKLMGRENEDVITDESAEVLLPSYTKFYIDESYSEDGDLIRGIDTARQCRLRAQCRREGARSPQRPPGRRRPGCGAGQRFHRVQRGASCSGSRS